MILSSIDDVGPALLIACLESAKELIERLVASGHRFDASIETLSTSLSLLLDEALQFLDLLNGLWAAGGLLPSSLATISEEEHLVFLEFILVLLQDHWGHCHLPTRSNGEAPHGQRLREEHGAAQQAACRELHTDY